MAWCVCGGGGVADDHGAPVTGDRWREDDDAAAAAAAADDADADDDSDGDDAESFIFQRKSRRPEIRASVS